MRRERGVPPKRALATRGNIMRSRCHHQAEKLPVPLVMLAAGTGGPMALQRIFRQLKSGSHAALVVVQQGPNWMLEAFVHRLQTRTTLHVALARDGEALLPGQVRIAPAGSHCARRTPDPIANARHGACKLSQAVS